MRRALLLLLVLALAACGGEEDAAAPNDGIRDLDNVLALRSDFEADAGKARVIILLSPT